MRTLRIPESAEALERESRQTEWSRALQSGPAAEPVSLAEQKLHSRIDSDLTDDDTLITALLLAARKQLENITGMSFVSQTWKFTCDHFPLGDAPLYLPRPPLQSITSIKYLDTNGAQQTLDPSGYKLDKDRWPCVIYLPYGASWPYSRDEPRAIEVVAVTGFGADSSSVPEELRLAVKMMAGYWYEHRELGEVIIGGEVNVIPKGLEYLLANYKMRRCA